MEKETKHNNAEEGALLFAITMYRKGKLTLEEAGDVLGMSAEEFAMKESEYE